MYKVLDVCRFVINYSNDSNYGISNLKLQKILYFIQAYFLINTDDKTPCFSEKIEAWEFGPVVPEAYNEYKQYGGTNIPYIKTYFVVDKDNIWDSYRENYDDSIIKEPDKKMIRDVVDKFSGYSATYLVTLTHNQSPWKDAYAPYMNNEITVEAIRDYFDE